MAVSIWVSSARARALFLAAFTAPVTGKTKLARMAMTAMTTNSSINVKALNRGTVEPWNRGIVELLQRDAEEANPPPPRFGAARRKASTRRHFVLARQDVKRKLRTPRALGWPMFALLPILVRGWRRFITGCRLSVRGLPAPSVR